MTGNHRTTRRRELGMSAWRAIGLLEVIVVLIGLAAAGFVAYTLWKSAQERDAKDPAFAAASNIASQATYLWQDIDGKPAGTALSTSGLTCVGACTVDEALQAATLLEAVPTVAPVEGVYAAFGPFPATVTIIEVAAEGKEPTQACVTYTQERFVASSGPCLTPAPAPDTDTPPAGAASSPAANPSKTP